MKWYRWGKPEDTRPMIPVVPPRELERQWTINIVTDTETIPVFPVPESHVQMFAEHWGRYGAMLLKDGHPSMFIPARRIMELRFEKYEED